MTMPAVKRVLLKLSGEVLMEQPYAKDDKQSISQLLGDAKLVRFAQVYIGS